MMKKIIFIVITLATVILAALSVFMGGVLFDTARQIRIEPFIFQFADQSQYRIGRPVALDVLESGDDAECFMPMTMQRPGLRCYVRDRLIIRFLREYFEVIPIPDYLDRRASPRGTLAMMSGIQTPVFANWQRDMRPILEQLVEDRRLRRIYVNPHFVPQGEYLVVRFDIVTYNPNDMYGHPEILRGQEVRLRVQYEPGIRDTLGGQSFDARAFLSGGGDPMIIFRFRIEEMIIIRNMEW